MSLDGPNIAFRIMVPRGEFILSLYDYNKDGHTGNNDLRDYSLHAETFLSDQLQDPDATTHPVSRAVARIHDFIPGVYKRFAVTGPCLVVLTVRRSHSLNTIVAGLFLDPLEDLPTPWLETSSLDPDYLMQSVHRRLIAVPGARGIPTPEEETRILMAIDGWKLRDMAFWAAEQRIAQAVLLSEQGTERTSHMNAFMDFYWDNALFPSWEECNRHLYGEAPRQVWQRVRPDESDGSGRGYPLLYNLVIINHER